MVWSVPSDFVAPKGPSSDPTSEINGVMSFCYVMDMQNKNSSELSFSLCNGSFEEKAVPTIGIKVKTNWFDFFHYANYIWPYTAKNSTKFKIRKFCSFSFQFNFFYKDNQFALLKKTTFFEFTVILYSTHFYIFLNYIYATNNKVIHLFLLLKTYILKEQK